MISKELVVIERYVPRNPVHEPNRDGFRADSLLVIDNADLGPIGVVRKKTHYVNSPADVMIMPLEGAISQITELSEAEAASFLLTCARVVDAMREISPDGSPVIAINQQPDCIMLPTKFAPDGTELKVQTIDAIHAHVFLEDGRGLPRGTISSMDKVASTDFFDPLGHAVSQLFISEVNRQLDEAGLATQSTYNTDHFPLGINVPFDGDIVAVLTDPRIARFIQATQRSYVQTYRMIEQIWQNYSGEARRDQITQFFSGLSGENIQVREFVERVILSLREDVSGVERHHRLVQGPALTWVIYERDGRCYIHLTPRFFSRGNAMEDLGVWVEPVEEVTPDLSEANDFYRLLMVKLGSTLLVSEGASLYEN